MHDPMTVAFDIKSPFRKKPCKFWPKGYRNTLVTIWHVDPENSKGKCGVSSDDTCGWFSPPFTPEDRDRIRKLGRDQYSTIFGKQHATKEGKSYAYISYEPTTYDAIYWAWRAIKYHNSRYKWQYGKSKNAMTNSELEEIYSLESNPVDNLRLTVAGVKDEESCADFFISVYRCYSRFNRPWYKHPRWHISHWKLQIHPLQKLNRWLFTRCHECGARFGWNESPIGDWSGKRCWHDACYPKMESNAKIPDSVTNTWMPTSIEQDNTLGVC